MKKIRMLCACALQLKIPLIVMSVISLLVGILTFSAVAYKSSTLVLEARTLKDGQGTVTVVKADSGESICQNFEILGDRGSKQMYVIELPATSLKSIEVAPLAPIGQFSLDRVIFSNGTASYFWDEQGLCLKQTLRQGLQTREACNNSSPVLTTDVDGSVIILSIPEAESANSIRARIMLSILMVLYTFSGGFWLLRPENESEQKGALHRYVVKASWLVVTVLYLYQVYLISRYSVDLPFEDEWDYFKVSSLSHDLSWRWLFSFHNEHRIVLTKLLTWLNLKLFGLDFAIQKLFNLLIFGGLLAALTVFKNRVVGRESFGLFPFFLIFLLSPIVMENHLWAFQSQFHLVLLFSVAALYHVYNRSTSNLSALIFGLYMLFAMYTFSAGLIFAVVYLFCVSIYTIAGIAGGRINSSFGWRFLLIAGAIIVAGIVLWFYGYVKPAWPPPKLYPSDFRFWEYFLNIVSFGFGINRVQILPGIACLLLATFPLVLLLGKLETRWQPSTWQVLTAIVAILAVLASISVGRGNFGEPKTSRYAEIGFMLIPYSSLAWWLVFKRGIQRNVIMISLWFFCFIGYLNNWSTQKYAEAKQIELYNLECVEGYFNGSGDGVCQGRTAAADLDRAMSMGAKFTRHFLSKTDGGR